LGSHESGCLRGKGKPTGSRDANGVSGFEDTVGHKPTLIKSLIFLTAQCKRGLWAKGGRKKGRTLSKDTGG